MLEPLEQLLKEARKLAQRKMLEPAAIVYNLRSEYLKFNLEKKVMDKVDTVKQQIDFLEFSLTDSFEGELSIKSREMIRKQANKFNELNG